MLTNSPSPLPTYTTRSTCRVCGSNKLTFLYDIGSQYVNNFLSPTESSGDPVPIALELCQECSLVQAKHTAPQDFLYTRHYWYKSGVTQTMRDSLREVACTIENMGILNPEDIVLDIGSNDGTLLRSYTFDNLIRVGVEPATNLAEQGAQGVDIFINEFWSAAEYQKVCHKKAKVITALGMFYDLEDPNQFIADIAEVLSPDGVFIAQLMCLKNMMELKDVGNLAHEHLEFYTLRSLEILLKAYGLEIFRVETNKVNGKSYRLFIRHIEGAFSVTAKDYRSVILAKKAERHLDRLQVHQQFYESLCKNKQNVVSYIQNIVDAGKSVWVYGASTKGNTILQFYGLDHTLITGAADKSPGKWGRRTVGTDIPIFSEDQARKAKPNYFLILPYAFVDEFIEREKEFLSQGGHFIVPLPELKII